MDDLQGPTFSKGARVTWTAIEGAEYYVQVTGESSGDFGEYVLTLSSPTFFSAEKVEGECAGRFGCTY
jgi:hypothetical protein